MLAYSIVAVLVAITGLLLLHQIRRIQTPLTSDFPEAIERTRQAYRLDRIAQRIRYYDEALTQSARNYVFTSEDKWLQRYRDAKTELDDTIAEAMTFGEPVDSDIFYSVYSANNVLLKMEQRAIELTQLGRTEQALEILDSPEYAAQKQLYAASLAKYSATRTLAYNRAVEDSNSVLIGALASLREHTRTSATLVALMTATAFAVVLAASYFFARLIRRPTRKLQTAAAQIGNGDLDIDVDIRTEDEFGDLAASFNTMAENLRTSTTSMDELNQEIYKRRQTQSELDTTLRRWRATFNAAGDSILVMDRDCRIKEANRTAAELVDSTPEQLTGRFCWEIFHDTAEPPEECPMRDILQKKEHIESEIYLETFEKWFQVSVDPVLDEYGEVFSTIHIARDITETKKAHEELTEANEKLNIIVASLERSNLELRDFVYAIAHDLKAPLRAVGTLADWLEIDSSEQLDESGRQRVRTLKGRANRMGALIDGLLEYAEVGTTPQSRQLTDLNALIAEIIRRLSPPANIEVIVQDRLPKIETDKDYATAIFTHLLQNAIQYNDKPAGRITISCREQDDLWSFAVSDNGPGIEPDRLDKIFKLFHTLDPNLETPRTGLGLAIVKKMVELMGGSIWADSQTGRGATFCFTLPRQPADVIEQAPLAAANVEITAERGRQ